MNNTDKTNYLTKIRLYVCDAFTTNGEPFTGNPAAVCLLEHDDQISDRIKQKIASEMNLSQTAFVSKSWTKQFDNKNDFETNEFTIRWFSPLNNLLVSNEYLNEIKLCGHTTFAASTVLFELIKNIFDHNNNNSIIKKNEIKFQTKFYGKLKAVMDWDHNNVTIILPINEPFSVLKLDNQWMEGMVNNILGPELSPDCIQEVLLSPVSYPLIRLKDNDQKLITKIKPNFEELKKYDINGEKSFGVIVTEKADLERNCVHFFSRFFASWNGINEDPVCGSAHTVLAPYWRKNLGIDGLLIGEQCSQRGGRVLCLIDGDKVHLSGSARIVFKAEMNL